MGYIVLRTFSFTDLETETQRGEIVGPRPCNSLLGLLQMPLKMIPYSTCEITVPQIKKRQLWKGTPDIPQLLLATGKTVVKGWPVSASEQVWGFLAVPLGFSFPIMSLIHSDWGSRAWRRYGHFLLPLWGMVVQPPRTMLLYCYISGCTWSNLLSQNKLLAFRYMEPIVFAKHIFIYNLIWASKHSWCK